MKVSSAGNFRIKDELGVALAKENDKRFLTLQSKLDLWTV